MQHGSVATKHGRDIHMLGKFRRRDATAFTRELGGIHVQHGCAAMCGQGSAETPKGG